ncbi:DUF1419 domain-containing protein [Leclercia adecarboxylata]|uniref:DUF1419 domain-containing protein n=1 Tax=Leclercia adecarboxylata TaxID=83655 RepID=UPI0011E03311|nr:DUF1419 domain-containing protein [Leclercia adecarboxylata]
MNVTTPTAAPMAFYVPSHNTVYAWAKQQNGEWVTEFGAKTLDTVRSMYPDAELMPFAQVQIMQNIGYRREWTEITQARYVNQLESLPPMDWCRGYGGESFKSMEFTGGDVTAIFVRYGERFFECRDLHTLTHRALIGEVINRFCLDEPLISAH